MKSSSLAGILRVHSRTLASILAVVLATNVVLVVHRSLDGGEPADGSLVAEGADPARDGATPSLDGTVPGTTPSGVAASKAGVTPNVSPTRDVRKAKAGSVIPGKGTVPFGINGNELTVVYYWKGDQTKSSPFLAGTGQEGNVDEGEAFTNLIAYINKHASGGGTIMGFPFDLHGWKLKPIVLEAGKGDDQIRAAEKIASEIKPFAAVSSHGSVSAYVCPRLAKAGILNISTYDLDWGLYERTNGFCLPQGLSFDSQVDLSISYLVADAKKHPERVYGYLYAEYPDLVRSGPKLLHRLRAAGVPIPDGAVATVDPDLTTAGREQVGVIKQFRDAGVNTIIAPESGSLITFTHAAEASQFRPNYYVWPCSGQDSLGMTRLYDPSQWTRAAGLTCYDEWLNADLTNDDRARETEWYKAYKEVDNGEPPAPTALVYQSLLPLVAGITHAGRDLTLERFFEGFQQVKPYRYHAIDGRTSNPANILVTINSPDGSQVGDAGVVKWDPQRTTPGAATPGTYVFLEDRRYRRGARF